MVSKMPGMPVHSAAPGMMPATVTGPLGNGSTVATGPDVAPAPNTARAREAS